MQRTLDDATLLDLICGDDVLRRQFLWLRAQEKGDLETAHDLEAVDPRLSDRVAALQAEFIAGGGRLDTPEQRREAFGRMQDELFERCAHTLGNS